MTATTGATDVQHDHRRCLDHDDLENYRYAGDATGIGRHKRALARDTHSGWCCTLVARGAYEAAGRPRNEAQQSTGPRGIAGLHRSGAATQ
jgi:hypothetical protein